MSEQAYKLYWKAMEVQDFRDAESVLLELIDLALKEEPELSTEEARKIQLANIGYFTGYLKDRAQQRRVLELFKSEHPIFGTYEGEEPSMEQVLRAGMVMAQAGFNKAGIAAAREVLEKPLENMAKEDGQSR